MPLNPLRSMLDFIQIDVIQMLKWTRLRRVDQRLRENGQIMGIYVNRGRPREVHTPALEEAVFETIENTPGRRIRGLAREFQVDYRTIQQILIDEHYHPYHYIKVQALHPRNYLPRV
ncbi:hypothetical protein BDFB_013435 [Asbolus verrucosus]|uniref:HTH 29 domain containing protein n=1 Tax=Asbolus verrucosus TaxID=1661398 RepID=A0A482W450_ASBVE|nr:hypothetical protein BDFB_013435 [Asbolus verrucosus]